MKINGINKISKVIKIHFETKNQKMITEICNLIISIGKTSHKMYLQKIYEIRITFINHWNQKSRILNKQRNDWLIKQNSDVKFVIYSR